jgi:hypothetical protein
MVNNDDLNLSVSDFLVGLIMIPYDISFVMVEDLRQNKWTCLLRETFQILTSIAKSHDAKIRSANHFLLLLCTCASGNIMAKYRSTEIRSRFSTDDPKNRIWKVSRNKHVHLFYVASRSSVWFGVCIAEEIYYSHKHCADFFLNS